MLSPRAELPDSLQKEGQMVEGKMGDAPLPGPFPWVASEQLTAVRELLTVAVCSNGCSRRRACHHEKGKGYSAWSVKAKKEETFLSKNY